MLLEVPRTECSRTVGWSVQRRPVKEVRIKVNRKKEEEHCEGQEGSKQI